MSLCKAMKEQIASAGVSSVLKDPSKRAKKRLLPLQCVDMDGVNEDDLTEKKRRLTVEQVKFLETNFITDVKLEPERKALLAKQLSVRPRQVAIWFQNRRARWKNKQVEQEYEILKASFEAVEKEKEKLLKDYEAALQGKEMLQAEVARLRSLLQSRMEKEVINNSSNTNGEQLSDKSERMSPTKSADEQSEVEGMVTSSDAKELAMTSTSVAEVVESMIVCATRLDGENAPWVPSHVDLRDLPVLVQQLIANGYCLEDALHIFSSFEDNFGCVFSLYESC